MAKLLLEVKGVKKYFPVMSGLLRRQIGEVRGVDGVDFKVERGKTLAIVGESGSGKTTLGKTIVHLYRPTSGSILFDGVDLAQLDEQQFKPYRTRLQMVFQDPTSSLNPRRKIRDMLLDPLRVNRIGTESERYQRGRRLIERVGLPVDFLHRYPHMLSGGQKQRVCIARAIISNPDLVVLDEPTSALDVSVQAQLVDLLQSLQEEFDLTYLFISHNLALVRNIANEVIVMYLGRVMEAGPTDEVFSNPRHPYTLALLSSIPPVIDEDAKVLPSKIKLSGEIPSSMRVPAGCRFVTRCPYKMPACETLEPPIVQVGLQDVRCHLYTWKDHPLYRVQA